MSSQKQHPTLKFNEDGSFSYSEWRAFWRSLSEAQKDRVRAKAHWEACSLSAVIRDWPSIIEEQL